MTVTELVIFNRVRMETNFLGKCAYSVRPNEVIEMTKLQSPLVMR